jgi:hypothetical protein
MRLRVISVSLPLLVGSCTESGTRIRGVVGAVSEQPTLLPAHGWYVFVDAGTGKCSDNVNSYVGPQTPVYRRTPFGLVRLTGDSLKKGQQVTATLNSN